MVERARSDSALAVAVSPAPPHELPHVRVGTTPIFDGAEREAVDWILEAIESRRGARVATANLDFLAIARHDEALRADLAGSSLVVADGSPVVWMARLAGGRRVKRVAGVDLATEICRRGSADTGLRVSLYGSDEETQQRAAAHLERQFPGLRVVSRLVPPYRPLSGDEQAAERRTIEQSDPELVLVALGCPRQERLIARYYDAAPHAAWIGIGGTFDIFANKRRRAPAAARALGLEWAVRFAQEPRRLWRRYVLRDVPALLVLGAGELRRAVGRMAVGRRRRGHRVSTDG